MNIHTQYIQGKKGYTVFELLLVLVVIALLVLYMILRFQYINLLPLTRNSERKSEVQELMNALYQYDIDNKEFPKGIEEYPKDICRLHVEKDCQGLLYLQDLVNDQRYLVSLPIDPSVNQGITTGYQIQRTAEGRIIVSAPLAENDEVIKIIR